MQFKLRRWRDAHVPMFLSFSIQPHARDCDDLAPTLCFLFHGRGRFRRRATDRRGREVVEPRRDVRQLERLADRR